MQAAVTDREAQLETFIAEQNRMRRERSLLGSEERTTLAKWESHLNRQLAQAQNELETLQNRRQGTPTPKSTVHFSAGS